MATNWCWMWVVYLSKLVEVMLHIFNGGINWQSSNKDLLCPCHQLATQKKKCLSDLICFWKIFWAFNLFPFSWRSVAFSSQRCMHMYRWLLVLGIHWCVCQSKTDWVCMRVFMCVCLLMVGGWVGYNYRVSVSRRTSGLVLLLGHCLTVIPANQGWVVRGDRWHHHHSSLLLTPSGCTHLRLGPAGKCHLRDDL